MSLDSKLKRGGKKWCMKKRKVENVQLPQPGHLAALIHLCDPRFLGPSQETIVFLVICDYNIK